MSSETIELSDFALPEERKYNTLVKECRCMVTDSDSCETGIHCVNRTTDGGMHSYFCEAYVQILTTTASIAVFTEALHGHLSFFQIQRYIFLYLLIFGLLFYIMAYLSTLWRKSAGICIGNTNKNLNSPDDVHIAEISLFLKIGFFVFGIGAFLYCVLEAAAVFAVSESCVPNLSATQPLLQALFTFVQTLFLLQKSSEVFKRTYWFHHLAYIHLVTTNTALWIRTLLWETAKEWLYATHVSLNTSFAWNQDELNITIHTLKPTLKFVDASSSQKYHEIRFTSNCWWRPVKTEEPEDITALQMCLQNSSVGYVWNISIHYLYPLVVMYYFIVAFAIYLIWKYFNVHEVEKYESFLNNCEQYHCCKSDLKFVSKLFIYKKHSAKGSFLGFIILITSIIASGILTFPGNQDLSVIISIFHCGIFITMMLATVLGLLQAKNPVFPPLIGFSYYFHTFGTLAVYVYGMLNIISASTLLYQVKPCLVFVESLLMIFQACSQSLFINEISAKRLESHRRQAVIFLSLCNISLWILELLTSYNPNRSQVQVEFYGNIAWPVITRVIYPVVYFYRFHSTLIFVEVYRKS